MWFKNLTVYSIQKPLNQTAESLHEALSAKPFSNCKSDQARSAGWVPPMGESFTHGANGCILITLKTQTKTVPAATINDALKERVSEIEKRERRKVGKQEKAGIKEQIFFELLPQAFPKNSELDAYIDTRNGWLIVNSSSEKAADDLSNELRNAIGSLPVATIDRSGSALSMTNWISKDEQLPPDFELGDECTLTSPNTAGASATFKKHELHTPEVMTNIDLGKQVSKLAMIWAGKIAFVVNDNYCINKLKFLGVLQEKMNEQDPQSHEERLDIEFTIMTGELALLLNELLPRANNHEQKSSLKIV